MSLLMASTFFWARITRINTVLVDAFIDLIRDELLNEAKKNV